MISQLLFIKKGDYKIFYYIYIFYKNCLIWYNPHQFFYPSISRNLTTVKYLVTFMLIYQAISIGLRKSFYKEIIKIEESIIKFNLKGGSK